MGRPIHHLGLDLHETGALEAVEHNKSMNNYVIKPFVFIGA